MLVNSAQSINEHGTINVKTWYENSNVFVSISDTGSGIPEENLNRLFEPFFTTKDVGNYQSAMK
jgi:signal transduction histidine kinase